MPNFKTILYLDDVRTPIPFGIDIVRNYNQFVEYLQTHEMPDLISFDHDLDVREHYPKEGENRIDFVIPYDKYKQKTGLHCARYIIENGLPIKGWMVHSLNAAGKINIETELRKYSPQTECKGLVIPYRILTS